MKMLGNLKKRKVASEYVRPVLEVVCDKCKKEIKDKYAHVQTSHSLWGNDSCESIVFYDLCFECAKKMFNEYLKEPRNTEHFEYECERVNFAEEIEMDEKGEIDIMERDRYEILKGEQR